MKQRDANVNDCDTTTGHDLAESYVSYKKSINLLKSIVDLQLKLRFDASVDELLLYTIYSNGMELF